MNPRSFGAQLRRAVEAYTKATGKEPRVEVVGERFFLHPSVEATDTAEADRLQAQFEEAFGGKR